MSQQSCTCTKSKCIKKYCACFAAGRQCTPACCCSDCLNDGHEHAVLVKVKRRKPPKAPKAPQRRKLPPETPPQKPRSAVVAAILAAQQAMGNSGLGITSTVNPGASPATREHPAPLVRNERATNTAKAKPKHKRKRKRKPKPKPKPASVSQPRSKLSKAQPRNPHAGTSQPQHQKRPRVRYQWDKPPRNTHPMTLGATPMPRGSFHGREAQPPGWEYGMASRVISALPSEDVYVDIPGA